MKTKFIILAFALCLFCFLAYKPSSNYFSATNHTLKKIGSIDVGVTNTEEI